MYFHMYVGTCVGAYVCINVQWSMFSLISLHDRYGGKIPHLNSERANELVYRAGLLWEVPVSLPLEIIGKLSCLPHIYLSARDSNSGPHTYTCPHIRENTSTTHTNNLL